MLPQYLQVLYKKDSDEKESKKLAEDLVKLPLEELFGLSMGKQACMDDQNWLEKFKGTPLFEQAVQLEQQAIQTEASNMQRRQMDEDVWRQQDQIRLQKRLLELQLVQAGAAAPASNPEAMEEQGMQLMQQGHAQEKAQQAAPPATAEPKMAQEKKAEIDLDKVAEDLKKKAAESKLKGVQKVLKAVAKENLGKKPGMSAAQGAAIGAVGGSAATYGAMKATEKKAAMPAAARHALIGGGIGAAAGSVLNPLMLTNEDRNKALEKGGPISRAAARHPGIAGALMGGVQGAGIGAALGNGLPRDAQFPALAGSLVGVPIAAGLTDKALKKQEDWRKADTEKASKEPVQEVGEKAGQAMARMEKDAFLPAVAGVGKAMLGGLKGMGQFGAQAAQGMTTAARQGGMAQMGQAAKNIGAAGVQQATQFAKQNPLAAMGLAGAGGLAVGGMRG